MNQRTRTIRGAVVGALAGSLFLLMPGSVEAAAGDITAVGWWTRSPTADAPDGGVTVGSAPDGPTSVAAIRVDLGSFGLERLVIQAQEAAATGVDLAKVKVCAAVDTWVPADGGALADAPAIDCATSVDFVRNATTKLWQADISGLVAGRTGSASVGLKGASVVPEDPTSLGIYEIRYARPTVAASTAAGGGTDDDDSGPIITGTTFAPGTTAPPSSGGGFDTPTFDPVTPSAPTATSPPAPTTTAAPVTPTTVADAEERALLPVGDDAGEGPGRPVQEAFLLVFLAAAIGGGVGGMSKLAELRGK